MRSFRNSIFASTTVFGAVQNSEIQKFRKSMLTVVVLVVGVVVDEDDVVDVVGV